MRLVAIWASVAAHLVTPKVGAAAGSPPDVATNCTAPWSDGLENLLALELTTAREERARARRRRSIPAERVPPPTDVARVTLDCQSGDRVQVRVELATGRRRSRGVDLSEVDPEVRARTVALTTTELVDALWTESARSGPAAPEHPPPPAKATEPASASARSEGFALWLSGGYSAAGQPVASLLALDAGAAFYFWSWLNAGLSLALEQGALDTPLAGVGIDRVSGGLFLTGSSRMGPFHLGVGPLWRIGWTRLVGEPAEAGVVGRDVSGAWSGIGVLGHALLELSGSRVAIGAFAEGGLILLPVVGTTTSGVSLYAVDGAWFTARLGPTFNF